MPKFLPPDEVEALREKGVVFPGEAPPIPAETVAKALGNVGLPHSDSVERMEADEEASGSLESLEDTSVMENYNQAHSATKKILNLVGENPPGLLHLDLTDQLVKLKPTFEVFEKLELEPEVVLTPIHRSVEFWEKLVVAVQDSPLHSGVPVPGTPGVTRNILQNGGLDTTKLVREDWSNLTNSKNEPDAWQLSVTSSLDQPIITGVTSYGYTDLGNGEPDLELNRLLVEMGEPLLPERNHAMDVLIRPDINPTAETYIMHQLSRIVRAKKMLDTTTYSWLSGRLSNGYGLRGDYWATTGNIGLKPRGLSVENPTGIRPSKSA